MTATKKRKIYFGVFWTILIFCFIISAGILMIVANGYRFNRENFKLEKTSTIILDGLTSNFKVKVDGKETTSNFPVRLKMLYPGRHEVEISKEKYQTWSKVFITSPDQAILMNNITLFYQNPVITTISSTEKDITKLQSNFATAQKSLTVENDEIWFQGKLITRFSQPVISAIYDQNTNHIFVQIGQEIRALNIDDLNEFILVKLGSNNSVSYTISGKNLNYLEGGTIYQAQVR